MRLTSLTKSCLWLWQVVCFWAKDSQTTRAALLLFLCQTFPKTLMIPDPNWNLILGGVMIPINHSCWSALRWFVQLIAGGLSQRLGDIDNHWDSSANPAIQNDCVFFWVSTGSISPTAFEVRRCNAILNFLTFPSMLVHNSLKSHAETGSLPAISSRPAVHLSLTGPLIVSSPKARIKGCCTSCIQHYQIECKAFLRVFSWK